MQPPISSVMYLTCSLQILRHAACPDSCYNRLRTVWHSGCRHAQCRRNTFLSLCSVSTNLNRKDGGLRHLKKECEAMATGNPPCLQVGNSCRYGDAEGRIHDAIITDIVSTFTCVVNLSYNGGSNEASNVPHSDYPTANHWGCAEEGAPQSWASAVRAS